MRACAASRAVNMRAWIRTPPHERPGMNDVLHRRAQRWQPAFLATGMSAFVAAVVTLVNTGFDGGFAMRWLLAWSLACPAAIVAAYLFRPLAWRAACAMAQLTGRA
jgi:hypothetical protein